MFLDIASHEGTFEKKIINEGFRMTNKASWLQNIWNDRFTRQTVQKLTSGLALIIVQQVNAEISKEKNLFQFSYFSRNSPIEQLVNKSNKIYYIHVRIFRKTVDIKVAGFRSDCFSKSRLYLTFLYTYLGRYLVSMASDWINIALFHLLLILLELIQKGSYSSLHWKLGKFSYIF